MLVKVPRLYKKRYLQKEIFTWHYLVKGYPLIARKDRFLPHISTMLPINWFPSWKEDLLGLPSTWSVFEILHHPALTFLDNLPFPTISRPTPASKVNHKPKRIHAHAFSGLKKPTLVRVGDGKAESNIEYNVKQHSSSQIGNQAEDCIYRTKYMTVLGM